MAIALVCGCALSPQRKAESLIANEQYREALRIYVSILNPHLREGKRYINYNVDAVTGIGIVYWHMGRFDTAEKILKWVNQRSPEFGKARFYLGVCHESRGRFDDAMRVYREYGTLPEKDGYRDAMRGRLNWLVREKITLEVKQAIRNEQSLSLFSVPEYSVGVLYFYNLTENTRWNPLQKGLAEMMITDLSQVDQLQVVERLRLQKLIEELNLGMTGLLEEERSAQIGKILGARTLVKGSYMIQENLDIEINTGTMDILEADQPEFSQFDGTMPDIFRLEKEIVLKVISDMGLSLTAEQRERILRMPTSNFRAFLNFCYGLDASDMGNIDLAQYYFGLALEIDPDFEMAKPYLFPISLFQAANIEDQQSMSRRVSQIVEPGSAVSADAIAERSDRFRVGLRERFQTMSQTMDVGFIPGNDTRKPYEEAISAGASVTLLPGPPAPPFIPDEWFLPGPPAPPNER